jgi:hypothetical protein
MTTDLQNTLFGACIKQAREFLKTEGDLLPFAFAVNSFGEVVSIAGYCGDAEPDVIEVIALLESAIQERDRLSPLQGAAICVDVIATPPGADLRCDALEVRIAMRTATSVNRYIPYQKTEEGPVFGQPYTEPGTLRVW